jgi:hypothetical protein
MQGKLKRRPTPTLVVAMVALFVALGGTAGAVVNAAVPLAKRALVADNSKKVGGQTGAQIAAAGAKAGAALALTQSPAGARPASSAAGLVVIKTASASIAADDAAPFTIACDAGQKIVSAGFSSDGPVQEFVESRPSNDTTWSMGLVNFDTSAGHPVTLYAVCLR